MPENIKCKSCGTKVFGITSGDPKPIGRERCPECGDEEFELLEEDSDS